MSEDVKVSVVSVPKRTPLEILEQMTNALSALDSGWKQAIEAISILNSKLMIHTERLNLLNDNVQALERKFEYLLDRINGFKTREFQITEKVIGKENP